MSEIQLVFLHTNQVLVPNCESQSHSNWATCVPINFKNAAQCFACFIILCWAKISFETRRKYYIIYFQIPQKVSETEGSSEMEQQLMNISKSQAQDHFCAIVSCFCFFVNVDLSTLDINQQKWYYWLTPTQEGNQASQNRFNKYIKPIEFRTMLEIRCLMLPLLLIDVITF